MQAVLCLSRPPTFRLSICRKADGCDRQQRVDQGRSCCDAVCYVPSTFIVSERPTVDSHGANKAFPEAVAGV
jgi:hypothetical protein